MLLELLCFTRNVLTALSWGVLVLSYWLDMRREPVGSCRIKRE